MWPFVSLKTSFLNNMIGSIFYCLEIGTTKEILINYYGLPANANIIFFIFTIFYRLKFMKKKKKIDDKDKLKEKEKENLKEKEKENRKKIE